MNLKNKTVPELLDILQALIAHGLTEADHDNALRLAQQRTFSRAEKVLISSWCSKYRMTQEKVDAQLVEAIR